MLMLHADGGCYPNPGQAKYGIVAKVNGVLVHQASVPIGWATNNIAEWRGALAALDYAIGYTMAYPERRVVLRMDSQLVVRQITGRYKTKNPGLKPLCQQGMAFVKCLEEQGVTVTVEWIPRERNTEADALT